MQVHFSARTACSYVHVCDLPVAVKASDQAIISCQKLCTLRVRNLYFLSFLVIIALIIHHRANVVHIQHVLHTHVCTYTCPQFFIL